MTTYKRLADFKIEIEGGLMVVLLDNEVQYEIAMINGTIDAFEACSNYIDRKVAEYEKALEERVLKAINEQTDSELERFIDKVNNSKKFTEEGLQFEEADGDYFLRLDHHQTHNMVGVRAFNGDVDKTIVFMYEDEQGITLDVTVDYINPASSWYDNSQYHLTKNFDPNSRKQFYTILKDILKGLNKNV
jgi:hypothetical protein